MDMHKVWEHDQKHATAVTEDSETSSVLTISTTAVSPRQSHRQDDSQQAKQQNLQST